MSRAVPEWVGKDHNTAIPPRVRLRVWEREKGRCGQCTRKILPGEPWTCEHLKALINAAPGENLNRETNLGVTCQNCLPQKNAADVAEKAATYRVKSKHLGLKPKAKAIIPGSRASKFKKRLDGTVVRRDS